MDPLVEIDCNRLAGPCMPDYKQHLDLILKAMREQGSIFSRELKVQSFLLKRTQVQFLVSFSIQGFHGNQPYKHIPYLGLHPEHSMNCPHCWELRQLDGAPARLEEGHALALTRKPGAPEGVTLIRGNPVNPEKRG